MVSDRPIKPKALLLFFFPFSSRTGFRFGSIALRTEHSQAARVSPQLFRYILPRSPQALFFFVSSHGLVILVDRYITPRYALRPKERQERYVPCLRTSQRANVPTCLLPYLSLVGPEEYFRPCLFILYFILFFSLVTLTSSPLSSLILVSRSVRQAQAQAQVQLPSDHRSRSRLLILGFEKFLVVNPSTPLPQDPRVSSPPSLQSLYPLTASEDL